MKKVLTILLAWIIMLSLGITVEADHVHTWSDWEYAYVGDCLAASIMYRSCDTCGAYEEKTLPKPDHTWSSWVSVIAADCYSGGLDERTCNVCGISETRNTPKTDHKYAFVKHNILPTCTIGFDLYACIYCGKEVEEEISPVFKHNWSEWTDYLSATVFRKGRLYRRCNDCNTFQYKTISKLKAYIKFTKNIVTIKNKKSIKLKVKMAKGDSVKIWKTSNKKIATVKKGKVTGKKKGKVKITAVTKTGKKATCTVKIK